MHTKTEPIAYWQAVQSLIAAVRGADSITPAMARALALLDSSDLAQEQHAVGVRGLVAMMSDLSEDHYCAGWLHDNEHYLWQCVQQPDLAYGHAPLDAETIADLRAAVAMVGGWVRCQGAPTHDAAFASLAEWEPLHVAWVAAQERERIIIATLHNTRPELLTWPATEGTA